MSDMSCKKKTIHWLHNDNFVPRVLRRTNGITGKSVTVYRRGQLKKRRSQGTFFPQSVFQGLITKLLPVWTYFLKDWHIFMIIPLFCGGRQPCLSGLHVTQADCWLRFNMASERYKNRWGICDRIRQALERACVGMQTTYHSGTGRESLCGIWWS